MENVFQTSYIPKPVDDKDTRFTYAAITQSCHFPLGLASLKGFRRSMSLTQASCTARPFMSEPTEAAVGEVLGTLSVEVLSI